MTRKEVLSLKKGDILQSNLSYGRLEVVRVWNYRIEYIIIIDDRGQKIHELSSCGVDDFEYYYKVVTIEGFEL